MSHQQQQQEPALKPGDVFPASRDPIASAERERALAPREGKGEGEGEDRLFVTETKLPGGKRLVTSSAKGQVLSQFAVPAPAEGAADQPCGEEDHKVTIGEALEAAAAGASADKQVGRSDAAAVQAAETRATRQGRAAADGVAAAVQKAAEENARAGGEEKEKVNISDVLGVATARLAEDKVVTREDAERVRAAEKRNSEEGGEGEGPVAAAMEAASRMNRGGVA